MLLRPSSIFQVTFPREYLLLDEFPGNVAPPIPSPRTCIPGGGNLVFTDASSRFSIVNGNLVLSSGLSAAYVASQQIFAHRAGRSHRVKLVSIPASTDRIDFGLSTTNTGDSTQCRLELSITPPLVITSMGVRDFSGSFVGLTTIIPTLPTFIQWVRLPDGRAALFGFNRLLWITTTASTTNRYWWASGQLTTWGWSIDRADVYDLPSPFNQNYGLALLNVSSPLIQPYTSIANQILELTITAPAVLANDSGIIYRYQDANNYWKAYFNSSGEFRLDSVNSGVVTNRINVAGVISGGSTVTIRIVCEGQKHNAYTISSGGVITKRGLEVSVNFLTTQNDVIPSIGVGWGVSNLRSYPIFSASYDILNYIF